MAGHCLDKGVEAQLRAISGNNVSYICACHSRCNDITLKLTVDML